MTITPYDPRHVLENFIATLGKADAGPIRDAAELSHPKDIIQLVLRHYIRVAEVAEEREFLRGAYLSLASYQQLSEPQRIALAALREVGPLGAAGSEELARQTERVADAVIPLGIVIQRLKTETALLTQELKHLPGAD